MDTTTTSTTTARTWEGAPCHVYSDAWGTIIHLPEGHADLGFAPGSQFYGEPDQEEQS